MTTANVREQLKIEGHLGPLKALDAPLTLEISPLTVLIGPQGTGKSLISPIQNLSITVKSYDRLDESVFRHGK